MRPIAHNVIHIQAAAPSKPPAGSPCNGCGVCCLAAPCPLGMVLSGRRTGTCAALQWDSAGQIYRCGAISEPLEVLLKLLPRHLNGLAPVAAPILGRAARRWVAVGIGCDSTLEVDTQGKAADDGRVGQ